MLPHSISTGGCTIVTIGTSSQCFHKEMIMATIMSIYQLLTGAVFPPDGLNADAKKEIDQI